jgi:acetylornithine deacetylase/succinyl-diaminopimelate desuccinylase-like protein
MSRETSASLFPAVALCLLAGAVGLTMALILPPAPRPADAPTCTSGDKCQWITEFSAGRAMQDLAVIAQEPHPMGVSQAHAEVRDYLLSEIRALGLEPQVQETMGVRTLQPGWLLGGAVENILVRVPGRDPDGAILMMSHYDTTPGAPGGVDSSSGVAAVLELLRALQAGPPLRQDTIFFFSDGEEPGTLGSHAFVAQHPWLEEVRLAINMDSYQMGPPMLVRTTTGNGVWVEGLARSATRPAWFPR